MRIKSKTVVALFVAGLFVLMAGCSIAFYKPKQMIITDPQKDFEILKRQVKNYKWKPSYEIIKNDVLTKDKKVCSAIFKALKEDKDIEMIRPIIQTDDYESKKLKPYFDKCPALKDKLKKATWIYPPAIDFYSNFDYRLYDIDFNSDPSDGKQSLFHSDGFYNKSIKRNNWSVYNILNFNKCEDNGRAYINGTFDYSTKKRIKNRANGVLKYKDHFYIYDFYTSIVTEGNLFEIDITKWNKTSISKTTIYCKYVRVVKGE